MRTPEERRLLRTHSVTITMTPRQAGEARAALCRAAWTEENGRLFAAASRITFGLWDAGWKEDSDDGRWLAERA